MALCMPFNGTAAAAHRRGRPSRTGTGLPPMLLNYSWTTGRNPKTAVQHQPGIHHPQKCSGRTSLCRLTGLLHLGHALVLVMTRTQQL